MSVVLALVLAAGACSGGNPATSPADGASTDQRGGDSDGPLAGSGGAGGAGAGSGGAGGGGSSRPGGGGGLGGNAGRDGGPTASDGDPVACNNLTQLGAAIKPTVSTTPRPATDNPAGGKIEDGTYTITGILAYNVPPGEAAILAGASFTGTLRITGNLFEWLFAEDHGSGRGPKEQRTTGTMTGTGNRLSSTLTCPPDPAPDVTYYTSTGNEIRMYGKVSASSDGSDGGSGSSGSSGSSDGGSGLAGADGSVGIREEMIMVLKRK